MKATLLVLSILVLVSCSKKSPERLTCDELKLELENIHELDQKYRAQEDDILAAYGPDSEEYEMVWEMINLTDSVNLHRIKSVLDNHGYPSVNCVGENAALTPILVIHHAPSYQLRVDYVKLFYEAYLKGDINESFFCLFLERMHIKRYDEHLKIESPYKMSEKIDTLIKRLELTDIVKTEAN